MFLLVRAIHVVDLSCFQFLFFFLDAAKKPACRGLKDKAAFELVCQQGKVGRSRGLLINK